MIRLILNCLLLIGLALSSCKSQVIETRNKVGRFDISFDGNQIIFECWNNNISSIYISDINGFNTKRVFSSNDTSYLAPSFSRNGDRILFIKNAKNKIESTLCIANTNESNPLELTDAKGKISEGIFSKYDNSIYFLGAQSYKNYSPVVRSDFHDMDIYSIEIDSKKIEKISDLKAYGFRALTEIDSANLLLEIYAGNNGGIFIFPKDSKTKSTRIVPLNNPREDASMYYKPVYSNELNGIAFIAPYELYFMDLNSKIAHLVVSRVGQSSFGMIRVSGERIYFTIANETMLYSIKYNGTDLKEIQFHELD